LLVDNGPLFTFFRDKPLCSRECMTHTAAHLRHASAFEAKRRQILRIQAPAMTP
jgi:hypothetical protein